MENYIENAKNDFCNGRPKQPPAKMTFVLARQHKWLCAGGPATHQHKGPFLLTQSC
jgi:hypothetical protein